MPCITHLQKQLHLPYAICRSRSVTPSPSTSSCTSWPTCGEKFRPSLSFFCSLLLLPWHCLWFFVLWERVPEHFFKLCRSLRFLYWYAFFSRFCRGHSATPCNQSTCRCSELTITGSNDLYWLCCSNPKYASVVLQPHLHSHTHLY